MTTPEITRERIEGFIEANSPNAHLLQWCLAALDHCREDLAEANTTLYAQRESAVYWQGRALLAEKFAETVSHMIEDGHPCGSKSADEWFGILARRLASFTSSNRA